MRSNRMTLEELFAVMSSAPIPVLLIFAFPPVDALALRFIHGKYRGGEAPWKYFYTVLVYLSCIPGMFMTWSLPISCLWKEST